MVSKKYVRPVAIIGAAAILMCVIGLAAAAYYLNGEAFRQMLVQRVNAEIAGSIAVGRHRLSLLRGAAELQDVTLSGADGHSLAKLDRLRIGIFWPALLKREIRLTRLDIRMASLDLSFDLQDRLPLATALSLPGPTAQPRSESGAWALTVDDVRIALGRVTFQRPSRQWRGSLARVELKGDGRVATPSGRATVSIGRLVWQAMPGPETAMENLALRMAYAPDQSRPIQLELQASQAALTLQGAVDWQAKVAGLDLDYSLDMDLDLVQSLLEPDLILGGRVKARGRVEGPMDDPGVTLELALTDGRVAEMSLQLNLSAGLQQRRLTLSSLQAVSPWGEAALSGTIDLRPMFARNWRQATAGLETPAFDLKLDASGLRPDRWPGIEVPFHAGAMRAAAHARGNGLPGGQITGDARVTVAAEEVQLAAGAPAIGLDLTADVKWADQVLDLIRCTAVSGANRLDARGSLDLASRRMDLRGDLDLPQMQRLGAQLAVALPGGRAKLSLHATGDLAVPRVQATLLGRDLAWGRWTFGKLLAESVLSPQGGLEISSLVLENQGTLVQGRGRLTLMDAQRRVLADPALDLSLDIAQLEVGDFTEFEPLGGHFNGRLTVAGSLRRPKADLQLDPSPLQWQELPFQARGRARWQDGRLDIPELHLAKEASVLKLQGSAVWQDAASGAWRSDPLVTAQLHSDSLSLENLRPEWKGPLRIEAQVAGAVSDLQGSYRIRGDALTVAGQPLQSLRSDGELRNRRLHVQRLTVRLDDGQELGARGWYGFNGRYDIDLAGTGIDLTHVAALQRAYPVAGRLNLSVKGSGSLERPNLTASVHVAQPRFQEQPMDDFNVDLTLAHQRLELTADLNFTLRGSARLDSGAYEVQAVFDHTDLSPYLALAAGAGWSGHLTGSLQAAGNWRSPMQTRLASRLTDLQLIYQSIPLASADALNIELREGVIKIPATRLRIMQQGHLALEASGTLQKDLDLRADGRLPLAALAPFTDLLLTAEGMLDIHLLARGTWPEIPWQVDLTLDDIGMTLPELAQSVSDVNGRLVLTPQALTVEKLAGRVDSGDFSLNGRIRLKQMQPVQGRLNLSARSLPLSWPGTMDLVLHGDLSLDGQDQGAVLSGRLDLVEGTYYKDVRLNLISAVKRPKRRRPARASQRSPEWMEAIDLDVTVGYRNPLLVDNNLANLRIAPNLQLRGTLARPVLNGRAEVTDGELIYRRKTFKVERGVVDFINPYDNEPVLDILSQSRIRNWLVSLAVTGTPDALRLKLSSDPPEADNDILSLILLGRTNKELMQGRGQSSQTTTQMLAALLATAWGEDVKKSTGVDILELETGAENDNDSQDRTQVTVGKRLSRRLTIKYAVESNQGDMIQKAISEYRFLEHLLVSGFQDSRGDYGGELLFRIEFQ